MTGSELLDACMTQQADQFQSHFKIVEQQLLIALRLLQVKDALGSWKDVHLAPYEVAIMFGQTATQASAGLFRPAIYRVVSVICCLPSVADFSDISPTSCFGLSISSLYDSVLYMAT